VYVIITRASDGSPAVCGPIPHTDPPTARDDRGSAFTLPLWPPDSVDRAHSWPRVVELTSGMVRTVANSMPVPQQAAPAVLMLVTLASRLAIAICPFGTAAEARTWRGGQDPDLARAGIACVALALSTPPAAETGGRR
jgi:hypothetical protein